MAKVQTDLDGLTEPLTDREQEILTCLAEGLSSQEIANRLYLTEKTVRWYNSQIYSKLGVHNRSAAVEQASALGSTHVPGRCDFRHTGPTTIYRGRPQFSLGVNKRLRNCAVCWRKTLPRW